MCRIINGYCVSELEDIISDVISDINLTYRYDLVRFAICELGASYEVDGCKYMYKANDYIPVNETVFDSKEFFVKDIEMLYNRCAVDMGYSKYINE